MSEFNVAIYSDKNFTQKSFVRTNNPWTMDGSSCDGGSTYSAYLFDDCIVEYANKHAGSFRGYDGPCVALGVHFDFDGPTAQEDAKDFLTRVYSDGDIFTDDDCKIWFSGSKGFHIIVGLSQGIIGPSVSTPDVVKQIAETIASRYISWDTSVYDRTRGMRVNNSRHNKSGLYKIELHSTELWSRTIDDIKRIARHPRTLKDTATLRDIVETNWKMNNA